METINFEQLLLKTAFCCMAADGKIDNREILTIENLCRNSGFFNKFSFQEEINALVNEINISGKQFIQAYFDLLTNSDLSDKEELTLIDFALKTIHANEQVEYSEVKFFKNIRHRLSLSDEKIIETYKKDYLEIEDFLEEDIKTDSFLDTITKEFFNISELPKFNIIDLEKKG